MILLRIVHDLLLLLDKVLRRLDLLLLVDWRLVVDHLAGVARLGDAAWQAGIGMSAANIVGPGQLKIRADILLHWLLLGLMLG